MLHLQPPPRPFSVCVCACVCVCVSVCACQLTPRRLCTVGHRMMPWKDQQTVAFPLERLWNPEAFLSECLNTAEATRCSHCQHPMPETWAPRPQGLENYSLSSLSVL